MATRASYDLGVLNLIHLTVAISSPPRKAAAGNTLPNLAAALWWERMAGDIDSQFENSCTHALFTRALRLLSSPGFHGKVRGTMSNLNAVSSRFPRKCFKNYDKYDIPLLPRRALRSPHRISLRRKRILQLKRLRNRR